MNFSEALEALKKEQWVARAGWNGKGMHVYLEDSFKMKIREGAFAGSYRHYGAYLVLYVGQDRHQPGWMPSMADLLADDWQIIEPH